MANRVSFPPHWSPYNVGNPFDNLPFELKNLIAPFIGNTEAIKKLVSRFGSELDAFFKEYKIQPFDFDTNQNLRLELIKTMIENKIILTDKDSLTKLLFAASYYGNVQTVQYLIKNGADINGTSLWKGSTALMLAAIMGHLALVQYLIDVADININAKDKDGKTALKLAEENENSRTAQYLKDHGAQINSRENASNIPPKKNIPKINPPQPSLIPKNEKPKGSFQLSPHQTPRPPRENDLSYTPHFQLSPEQIASFQTRLPTYLNLNDFDRTPLHVQNDKTEISTGPIWKPLPEEERFAGPPPKGFVSIPFPEKKGNPNPPLEVTTPDDDEVLDDNKNPLPQKDQSLSPALNFIIIDFFKGDRRKIIELVFEYGPQFDAHFAENNNKRTSIDRDLLENENLRLEIIKAMIPKEILTDKDSLNKLLFAASYFGNVETVQYLTEVGGADINAKDNDGRTALMLAVIMGHFATVTYIVKKLKGADINAKDNDGRTALMFAAIYNKRDAQILAYLIGNGADINATDNGLRTAETHAINNNNVVTQIYLNEKKQPRKSFIWF